MERIFTPSIIATGIMLVASSAHGQGCVAIRNSASCNLNAFTNYTLQEEGWLLSANYRYFESFRHFRGNEEDVDEETGLTRIEEGTQVINWATSLNIGLTRNFDKRRGVTFVLPWVYNVRSSMYEHGGNALGERHTTESSGIGDLQATFNYWLFNPDSSQNGNLMVAAGIKLPTGEFNYRDLFYNQLDLDGDGQKTDGEIRPVDQSIQPGDGGLGFPLAMQGYATLADPIYVYVNGYYLLNPQQDNNTRRSETSAPLSIPDQYMARAGLNWNVNHRIGLNMFCGGRIEGIPSEDLLGDSHGSRRPGYVISVEPGIDWARGLHDFNISIPVAVERNRTQSVSDKEATAQTGVYTIGDAAFADYVINISWSMRLTGNRGLMH